MLKSSKKLQIIMEQCLGKVQRNFKKNLNNGEKTLSKFSVTLGKV